MLTLTVREGEFVQIGESIVYAHRAGNRLKLSIEAPLSVKILREKFVKRNGQSRQDEEGQQAQAAATEAGMGV